MAHSLDARFQVRPFNYPADFVRDRFEPGNIQRVITELMETIRRSPWPVVLIGYYQGAQYIRMLLAEHATGFHADLRIVAAGLIGDPWRPYDAQDISQLHAHSLKGSGVAGHYDGEWSPETRVWQIVMPCDIVANASSDSPARTAIAWSRFLVAGSAQQWSDSAVEALKVDRRSAARRNWRRPVVSWRRYSNAVEAIQRYGIDKGHSYVTQSIPDLGRTYCEFLANRLNTLP